jgi:hypothetical protein
MNPAIALIKMPIWSKKSRRVEWFFASGLSGG